MSAGALYRYIYVTADGTARELHADERAYLETPFKGGDGALPYIKSSDDQRNGWGNYRLHGRALLAVSHLVTTGLIRWPMLTARGTFSHRDKAALQSPADIDPLRRAVGGRHAVARAGH